MKAFSAERIFTLFLFAHVIAWTLAPALIRSNLPLDAIEGTVWGHNMQWGYDKNPFLNAWLTLLATHLGGERMVYFFSQLSVGACFWAVFNLGKKIFSPTYALIAVMLLEGLQYFSFHAIDFDDNVIELGTWALTIYFFYQALTTKRVFDWLLTGFFAGFGIMAKYYTLALLASLALFLLCDKESRKQLTTYRPYVGLLILMMIITPHLLWLPQHQFITISYVFQRTSAAPSIMNHLYFPLQFAWQQFEVFIPALAIYLLLFLGKAPRTNDNPLFLTPFNQSFLLFTGLGPFILTLLLSIITGAKLRAGWGMPLLSFWPLILFIIAKPRLSLTKMRTFIVGIFLLMITLLTSYYFSIVNSSSTSTANFPGKEIATTITQHWHDTYHTPLRYVAGSRWVGGNIEFYSKDHPSVYMEWNPVRSAWINEADLRKNGAVFVWDMDAHETLPQAVKARFPTLSQPVVMEFDWLRNKHNLPRMKIGVAYLAPENQLQTH